jgi:hypothetical protein
MESYKFHNATPVSALPLSRNHKCLLTPWKPAAWHELSEQSHKQSSRHVSRPSCLHSSARRHYCSSWISPSAHHGVVTHTPLTLTQFLQDSPATSCIHFSPLCQVITPPLLAAGWRAAHNKMPAFTGRWPQGCMTLHPPHLKICIFSAKSAQLQKYQLHPKCYKNYISTPEITKITNTTISIYTLLILCVTVFLGGGGEGCLGSWPHDYCTFVLSRPYFALIHTYLPVRIV